MGDEPRPRYSATIRGGDQPGEHLLRGSRLMEVLSDTNLVLRIAEPAHAMHAEAFRAMQALRLPGEQPCLVTQNLYEFWVVATRPRERNGLGMTAEQPEAELARLENQFPVLPDTP